MNEKYIELRTRSSFGDIINTYFLFLKHNFKAYTNLYLRYNAISIILTLICSYLLVTGFMGLASRDFRFGMGNNIATESYFIAGVIILLLIVFVTSLINYSFSSAFIADYVNNEGHVESKRIWRSILKNIGTIIVFILIGALLYIVYFIISGILAFIPFLGMLIQYGLSFTMTAIFGLTFMSIFSSNKGFSEAISEGFDFSFSNFWRVILYGLVIGILNFIIMSMLSLIPSVIMGIYVYFSVDSGVDIATSVFSKIVLTLWFTCFLLAFIYSQALSQLSYGVLYYNLNEVKYNVFLQKKIDQIGVNE
ncbi:hypothetical protein H8K90_10735 [Winogradskyella echinorum]|uniref:Membrane domain of glycerophosphoryl diester phosphodiesterase n=1 Tax=Winogradskyella echinorum TaxID=538189 RepID=A0ABR6Y291_9FLAO|nr:hypothetical protein [Winogradskyella echinorum]MBC3846856.1 hypothetical protein [Winogradskyella echinorum]MBC5751204.1 hypothetical protein [Winogradskyella echinorum]